MDTDSGEMVYRLADLTLTEYVQYREGDIRDCFRSTGIRNKRGKDNTIIGSASCGRASEGGGKGIKNVFRTPRH